MGRSAPKHSVPVPGCALLRPPGAPTPRKAPAPTEWLERLDEEASQAPYGIGEIDVGRRLVEDL